MRTLCDRRATPRILIDLSLSLEVLLQNLMTIPLPLVIRLNTFRPSIARESASVSQAQKRSRLVYIIARVLFMTTMDAKDWLEQQRLPLPLAPPRHCHGQKREMFRIEVSRLARLHMEMFRQLLLRRIPRQAISQASRHLITIPRLWLPRLLLLRDLLTFRRLPRDTSMELRTSTHLELHILRLLLLPRLGCQAPVNDL
jgi:hypothetical protein